MRQVLYCLLLVPIAIVGCSRYSASSADTLGQTLDRLSASSPQAAQNLARQSLGSPSYAGNIAAQAEAYYALSKSMLEQKKYTEDMGSALYYAKISLHAFTRSANSHGMARAHWLLASIYTFGIPAEGEAVNTFRINEKQLPDTIHRHLELSRSLLPRIPLDRDSLVMAARILLLEGILRSRKQDSKSSLAGGSPLLKQALGLFVTAGHHEGIGIAYRNLSILFEKEGKLDSALYFGKMAQAAHAQERSSIGLHHALRNLGDLFAGTYKGKDSEHYLDSALYRYRQALLIPETDRAETFLDMGLAYHKALMHLKEASPLFLAYLDSCANMYQRGMDAAETENNLLALYHIGNNLPAICSEMAVYGVVGACKQDLDSINQVYFRMASSIRKEQVSAEEAYNNYRLELAQSESRRRILQVLIMGFCSLLVLGTLAYGLHQSRLARAYRKELMARLQALQAWLNPHFTNGALNAIDLLFKTNNENASSYLVKFSRLTHMLMAFSTDKHITVEQELSFLEYYLDLEKLRFGDKLNCSLIVELRDAQSELMIPPMMIQPFVENAIKHGIQPKKEAGNLIIHFLQKGNLLQCSIDDDGVGRKSHEAREKPYGDRPSSTETILQRVELMKKIQNASLEIIDLVDPLDGKALGTRVEINIPLKFKTMSHGNI